MAKILNFKKHQLPRHAIPSPVFYFITFEKSMNFQHEFVFTVQHKEIYKKFVKIIDLQLFHLFKINFHCFQKSCFCLYILVLS